jgi:hypothetical protein
VIDCECEAELTVAVRHDDVKLRGLKVVGAGTGAFPIAVDFRGVSGGGVRDVVMKDTCGDAEYGVNLFETGPIDVRDSRAVGFSDAGFYAGAISGNAGRRDPLPGQRGVPQHTRRDRRELRRRRHPRQRQRLQLQ